MRKQNKRNIKKNKKALNAKFRSSMFRKLKANPNVTILDMGGLFKTEEAPMVFTNPNKDKGVKATNKLNEVVDYLEKNIQAPEGLKSGFIFNPLNFKWNLEIEYLNSKMVCEETKDGKISVWMYLKDKSQMFADEEVDIIWTDAQTFSLTVSGFLSAAKLYSEGKEVSFIVS